MRARQQVDRFVLLELLGTGARSQVWRVRDESNGRERALKLVDGADRAACARLRKESRLGARFRHHHVLHVGYTGEDMVAGVAWLEMEALTGRRAALSLASFRQLLGALAHVHAAGVVHCDVKPGNLLADAQGALKLADFGLARRAGQGAGPVHGSPAYMSPEQLRGQALDARSDVFAAGVVLYELLTGRQPFRGTPFGIVQQILVSTPTPPSSFDARIGPQADAILQQALALRPSARFPDAIVFLTLMDAFTHAG